MSEAPSRAAQIRPAILEDIPAIVDLWREMWDFHAERDPRYRTTPFADAVMAEWIGKNIASDTARVLVAQSQGVAGYACGMILENPPVVPWTRFGYISELAVAGPFRRGGLGVALVGAMDEWFRSGGIPYVEVNVSVVNAMARSFWRKVGYTEFLERLRKEL